MELHTHEIRTNLASRTRVHSNFIRGSDWYVQFSFHTHTCDVSDIETILNYVARSRSPANVVFQQKPNPCPIKYFCCVKVSERRPRRMALISRRQKDGAVATFLKRNGDRVDMYRICGGNIFDFDASKLIFDFDSLVGRNQKLEFRLN